MAIFFRPLHFAKPHPAGNRNSDCRQFAIIAPWESAPVFKPLPPALLHSTLPGSSYWQVRAPLENGIQGKIPIAEEDPFFGKGEKMPFHPPLSPTALNRIFIFSPSRRGKRSNAKEGGERRTVAKPSPAKSRPHPKPATRSRRLW